MQPTGLICHVEAFQLPTMMLAEENPAQVTDLPVPPANTSCALRIRLPELVESKSDDHR